MHPSAYKNALKFRKKYLSGATDNQMNILEVGSFVVDDKWGSMHSIFGKNDKWNYIGADVNSGKNVDVVLQDTYNFPFEDNFFDVVVSSSCMEHNEMFWLTFKEIVRTTKHNGMVYICTPSQGKVYKYPVDCWRFYPDAYSALCKWCPEANLLESYIDNDGIWKDNVGIFKVLKGA